MFILAVSFLLINQSYAQNYNDDDAKINLREQPIYFSLKKALRNKEKVYKLNLSNKGLKEFPTEIFELRELRYLILDSNQIAIIPEAINLLEKLEIFSIAMNNIQSIPSSIGELQHLTFLYINFNRIVDLPPELFFLHDLEELYINNNRLKKFSSDFMKLKELRTLVASTNEFENIPDEIGHLYNLRKLALSDNHLKELPDKFFELSSLEFLYLYGNQLTSIDGNIEKLKKLEFLDLSENKIKSLPPEIGKLYQLKKLYIANNKLEGFPSEINNLVNLSILSLDNNPIKSLPTELVSLKKLKYLYIEGNNFDPFPQILYDLQNNGVKIFGLATKELYKAKLLLSQARNRKLIENYSEAIEKYNELLQIDTNNIQAMSELASSFLENGDFDLAKDICEKVLAKNPGDELARTIKSTYDNSISRTNKLTRLNDEYEARFNEDTLDVTPYFDLGKYYYDLKKYDNAIIYFQKVIKQDPSHANSHFYLALVSLIQEQETPFIFATLRYLILKQSGRKTETILPFLFNKMKMKTGIEGKKGNTSYYDSYIIKDDNGEIIYKSDSPTADLLGAMMLDLTISNLIMDDTLKHDTIVKALAQTVLQTNKNNIEIFQYELNRICKSDTNEIEQNGSFFMDYYLPYYTDLINNGYLETFAYIINSIRQKGINSIRPNGKNNFAIWLKNNPDKVDKYYVWSKNYKWDTEQTSPKKK